MFDHCPNPAGALLDEFGTVFLQKTAVIVAEAVEPVEVQAVNQRLQAGDIVRQAFEEFGDLRAKNRQHDEHGSEEKHDEEEQDDDDGEETRHAHPLEKIGHRIKEIGQRHASHERQQDVAQHPKDQHEDGKRHRPENCLAANGKLLSLIHAGLPRAAMRNP